MALRIISGCVGIFVGGGVGLSTMGPTVMNESPAKASSHDTHVTRRIVSDSVLAEFRDKGVVVIDDVLTVNELRKARSEVTTMMEDQANDNENESVRKDLVFWVHEKAGCNMHVPRVGAGLQQVVRRIRSVPLELLDRPAARPELDESTFGVPLSNQLACYDGNGAGYVAHRDRPEGGSDLLANHPLRWLLHSGLDDRKVTIILYLNDREWDSSAGGSTQESGHLKCYLNTTRGDTDGSTASSVLSIAPKGGRMVIFLSNILHEVLPTAQRRVALTCWVGGAHSRYEALRPLFVPLNELSWFKR